LLKFEFFFIYSHKSTHMKQGHIHLFIHCNVHTWNRGTSVCNLHTLQSIHSSTYITIYSFIYIHCNLFIHSSIRSIKRRFLVNWPRCAGDGGFHARAVERRLWRRRRPARAASMMVEEIDLSDVDDGREDWQSREWRSRERWGLKKFYDEKLNDTGRATIYRFKNISSGS
jgi:hypothetical protein